MPHALVDSAFTFHHLFLDATNNPVTLTTPTIDVFSFNSSGTKVTHVLGATLTAVTGDTGRYSYTYTINSVTHSPGDVVYGKLQGIDPGTGNDLIQEIAVNVLGAADVGATGINHTFV